MNAQPDELASATPAAPEAPRRLPFAYAKRHGVLVNQWDNGRAIVWCRPDVSAATLAEVRRYLGAPITLETIDTDRFDYQLRQAYEQGSSEAMDIMGDLGDDNMDLSRIAQALPEPEDLLESEDAAPIIRLINALLTEAVKENASDIHIAPYEHRLKIRNRVDGVLREVLEPRRVLAPLVTARGGGGAGRGGAGGRRPRGGRGSRR